MSKQSSQGHQYTLEDGEHLAWQPRRGATLLVHRGRVWVTASDCLDDHFVGAGQSLVLPRFASVLISGEGGLAVLSLELEPTALQRALRWARRKACRLGRASAASRIAGRRLEFHPEGDSVGRDDESVVWIANSLT